MGVLIIHACTLAHMHAREITKNQPPGAASPNDPAEREHESTRNESPPAPIAAFGAVGAWVEVVASGLVWLWMGI